MSEEVEELLQALDRVERYIRYLDMRASGDTYVAWGLAVAAGSLLTFLFSLLAPLLGALTGPAIGMSWFILMALAIFVSGGRARRLWALMLVGKSPEERARLRRSWRVRWTLAAIAWAGVLGGAVAGGLYLALAMKDYTALRMGLWGLLGFGLGFIIADLACMGCERAGWRIDAWKVAEHTMGFLGGISLAIAVARQGRPIEPVEIAPMLRVISVLMIAWFVPYLNVTNTFEYLIAEGKITRWPMALFQVLAIVALFASILYLSWLAPRWDGDGASPKLLIGVMAFLTFLGIVKDGPSLGVGRLDVYLTFIGLFAVGSVMAVVFSR